VARGPPVTIPDLLTARAAVILSPVLRLSLILAAAFFFLPAHPSADSDAPPAAVTQAQTAPSRAALAPVEAALHAGDAASAERLALDAYLVFEEIEPRIGAVDPGLVSELEAAYGAVRARAASGDVAGARVELARVRELLTRAGGDAAPLGPRATFFHSFGILFREGLEALLLCAALAAATTASRRAGAPATEGRRGSDRRTRAIAYGALAALAASVATAVLVETVIDLAPAGREALEGVTMLLAAAVLFYVSYWLLSKVEVARWMAFLRSHAGKAESTWAIFGVAFLAVYREGAETILFYQALAGVGQAAPIAAGFMAAAAVLLVVGVAVLWFGVRLPIRPLFAVTGAFLYYLAVVFAGQGVHELQEAGWVTLTPVAGFPEVGWLGLYATVETLAAQALLVTMAVLAALVLALRPRRAVARSSQAA